MNHDAAAQKIITDLISAGKAMLERFDRSKYTKEPCIRPCRRMRGAITAAEEALRDAARKEVHDEPR
jgi:hypothetical protein